MANRRPLSYPRFQAWDDDETFLNGGTVTFYDAGTTNKRNVYQDAALTTTAPNPVNLNSRGEPESAGGTPIDIYLDSNAYKIVLKDSSGVTVHTIDGYIQNPNPLTPNSPADAKDQSTDVFEGTLNNDPVSGDIFEVDFKSANTTTTPTFKNTGGGLGALTIKTWDKSPVWSHAISGVHSLYYDGTDYLVINPHDGIRTVDSLSNLQSLVVSNIPDGYTAYLRGRSSLGDGGEGHFRWDSSNLSTEVGNDEVTANEGDGGIYVAPDSDKTGASGAWVRQFTGARNVVWYGMSATGTASANDSAFQAALNGLPAKGGTIYIPGANSSYLLGTSITSAQTNDVLNIVGDGTGLTVLEWTSVGGLDFDFDTPNGTTDFQCTVHGLSLITTVAGAGTAIDLSWATAVGDTSKGALIDNVEIYPKDKDQNQYWTGGIRLNNARNSKIYNSVIQGKTNDITMNYAIKLDGGTVECKVSDSELFSCDTALLINDECEGVFTYANSMIYVGQGVYWNPTSYTGTFLTVQGSHISALTSSIRANNLAHVFISGNLIQKREGTGNNYTDVKIDNDCVDWYIHDNHFQLRGTGGTEDGIVVEDDAGNSEILIHDNKFENRDKAIWIRGLSNNCLAHSNRGADVATFLQNESSASSHRLEGNYDVTVSVTVFSAGDETPSVGSSETEHFRTNNSVATTITNFDDPYSGQVIHVLANDGNTTVQHNSGLLLNGSTDFSMSAGNVLSLRYESDIGAWREISRSA